MKLNLNEDVKKLIPKVDHIFLFNDNECSLLLHSCMRHPKGGNTRKKVSMKSLTDSLTAQISVYEMPNDKFCAVAYPCSVKVNYDIFNKKIHEIFKHVDRRNWSSSVYPFFLYCVKNGYKNLLNKMVI